MPKKLIAGWFTFTCSEDSTIVMTELLNTRWSEWKNWLDFKYAKTLRKSGPLGSMDVAFIEGAISSETQAAKLKQIRSLAKTLIAIGACAVTGYPSAQRNQFNPDQMKIIQPILDRFKYAEKVRKVSAVVKVDHSIPGCPMDEEKFIKLINQFLTQANASSKF